MKIDFAKKKYCILDLDGTLYKGRDVFPYTLKFLQALRKTGRTPIFLTNNSSKSTREYFEKLKKLGFTKDVKEIYTSGRATIEFLQKKGIKKIFLLATPGVEKEFKDARFEIKNTTRAQAVVLTFDMTFTYEKFCKAYDLIMDGVPFYASHPDIQLPLEGDRFHPDIGTFISAFKTATGKLPVVIGKPQKHIYQQLRANLKCKKSEMVMVGDRLSTDIKGANDYGIDTILVLSGETKRSMLTRRAPKPTLIVENVGNLIQYLQWNILT